MPPSPPTLQPVLPSFQPLVDFGLRVVGLDVMSIPALHSYVSVSADSRDDSGDLRNARPPPPPSLPLLCALELFML